MTKPMSKVAMRLERVRLSARADALFDARHAASILSLGLDRLDRLGVAGDVLRALDEKLHRMEMEAHCQIDALDAAEAGGDEG